jgi:hypothetical protein
MVEGQIDVPARLGGLRAQDLDRAPGGVADDRLLAGAAAQGAVQRKLEAGEAPVVRSREAEHLRRHAALWVHSLLLGHEPESGDLLLLEQLRALGIGLAGDVHEPPRAVGNQRIDVLG